MNNGIKLYKDEDALYILELWGGSTKHPDLVFKMKNYQFPFWADPNDKNDVELLVFQWLLECASKQIFPFHAKEIVEYALENWYKC